jgi:putative flippase GtrA
LNRQIRGFVLVNMVGLTQTWLLSLLLVNWLLPRIGWTFHAEALAHAAALAAPTITSWFGHRYLTFAQK